MDARIIQQQILLGSSVTFFLKTGQSLSGILTELSKNYLVIESRNKKTTIFLEMIGAWEVEEKAEDQIDDLVFDKMLPDTSSEVPTSIEASLPPPTVSIHQGNGSFLDTATPPASSDSEIIKSLLTVEAKYEARIQFAQLEPDRVEFQFPNEEIEESHCPEIRTAWQNAKSIYDYAVKVQELDPKHGRIGRFAFQLARLAEQYPEIHTLKRQAAQAALLAGRQQDASELWKKVAIATQGTTDWKNVAASALQNKEDSMACFALGQYYIHASISEEDATWFLFVSLVRKFSSYNLLLLIIQSRANFNNEEKHSLFETCIYLLMIDGRASLAESYITNVKDDPPSLELLVDLCKQFPKEPIKAYEQIATELETAMRMRDLSRYQQMVDNAKREKQPSGHNSRGYVTVYKEDKGYGFISGENGTRYFFHRSSISDSSLMRMLGERSQSEPEVRFLAAQGDRGPFAYDIEVFRSIEDMAKLALQYADMTDYQKAAAEMRHILRLQPDYPNGQDLYAKWHHFASEKKLRGTGLPRGNNYYARAKCADIIEHDLDRAADLLNLAIKHNDRTESAVKDLAMVLSQLGRNQQAIDLLNNYRDQSKDPRTFDGILMTLYQKTGEADKAIPLLYKRAEVAANSTKRAQILLNIANLHMAQQKFDSAEQVLRQVLIAQPGNTTAKRHIAISLLKLNRLDEAERILNEILEQTSDAQSAEVLSAVQQARSGNIPTDIDILINTALSDFLTEISTFTKFFLDNCDYKGVPSERIQAQKFNQTDVEKLEERATLLGSRLPRDRSSFYLSAAKIDSTLEDSDPNRFFRYLCRSFSSMGDAIMQESSMLDSACDLYCEALAVYDNDHTRGGDEQDAANALIRVLYATLGADRIPLMVSRKHLSIDEAIESVISQHPDRTRVYRYIAYLIYRSRYAAARVLTRLYRSDWKASALDYLCNQNVEMPEQVKNPDEFARLWNALRRRHFEEYRVVSSEFRFLTQIEIVPSAIENGISRIHSIDELLFFKLDRERLREFQTILESTLELCRQTAFEERERFCLLAESRCRELIREIDTSPTKFSIEQLLPVLQSLQNKLNTWIDEFYQRSTPSLSLHLAIESYSPDNLRQIEVQVAIENQTGRSPAESIELVVVHENEQIFSLPKSDLRLNGSLRGGDQAIILIPLQLTPEALDAEAFSMNVYVQYRTRSDQEPLVVTENFSIQLASEFEDFDNPYHAYAKGGVVRESKMFYGRDEMVNNIVHTLVNNPTSKSVALYGQKRSGKSSILFHLKSGLERNPDMIVLDIENIGGLLDELSQTPLLYQILWNILRQFQRSILRREETGYNKLGLLFPTDLEFYTHPAPLSAFNDLFEDFNIRIVQWPDWKNVRLVLLIDEFSYIYGKIVSGALSPDFMKNWKALLQRNYFSTVLAGHDIMPKFIQSYSNEFGTIEDRQVGYLNEEDARALIDEPIRIGGKTGESRYREQAIERIIELAAGNPFYIQIICNRLVEHMRTKRQKLATKADVERIRDTLISDVDALTLSDFENLINSGDVPPGTIDNNALQVLKAVARNTRQVSTCARGEIVCDVERPINVILEDLVHRKVLECERSSYYRIRVGLFKEWLIANG